MNIVIKRERSLQQCKNREQKPYATEEVNTSEAKECWFQIKDLKMWNSGVKISSYQYSTL
jgi:hypothetical protein